MTGTTFDTAIEISQGNYQTFISSTEPKRYVKFSCEVGLIYNISANSEHDTTMDLYDGNGNHVNYNDDTNGRNPFIQFTATTPYMYAMVKGYNNPSGSYAPSITLTLEIYDPTIVQQVNIIPDFARLSVGGTVQLEIEVIPFTATYDRAIWTTVDSTIVEINETTGLLTGLSLGMTEIMVRLVDSEGNELGGAYIYAEVLDATSSTGTSRSVKMGDWVNGKMHSPDYDN